MDEQCYICGQELRPETMGGSRCAGCNRPICEQHTVLYTGQAEFEDGATAQTITQMCSACADNINEAMKNVVFTRGLFGISLGRHKDSAVVKLAAELDAMYSTREGPLCDLPAELEICVGCGQALGRDSLDQDLNGLWYCGDCWPQGNWPDEVKEESLQYDFLCPDCGHPGDLSEAENGTEVYTCGRCGADWSPAADLAIDADGRYG